MKAPDALTFAEAREALREAVAFSVGEVVSTSGADVILREMEARGITIVPVGVRRTCDVFGTSAMARTEDGRYAVVDPTRFTLHVTRTEG